MYLAGVSVRRVEDITEALWGSKVSPSTISELNKKAYGNIEAWRNRPLEGIEYPYVYVDGIYLKRNWGGNYENVSILVAIGVDSEGFREVLGAAEVMKEDKAVPLRVVSSVKAGTGMFQSVCLAVHTEIQSPAIESCPSRPAGSQSLVVDIIVSPCFYEGRNCPRLRQNCLILRWDCPLSG